MEFFVILLLLCLLGLFLWPIETKSLRPAERPVLDFHESLNRIQTKIRDEEQDAAFYGHSLVLTHGHPTEKVVVCYHGFTNCPRQYEEFAKDLFERGHNVYVPRVPHHGLPDLTTKEIAKVTIQELMTVCDESVNLACGLGRHVIVLGLSMGGVMASWVAQFRGDVDRVVVIVPSFGWYFFPGLIVPVINMCRILPNMFLWWDPAKKDHRNAPYSMYHKFSTKGMGHIMRMGLSVLDDSRRYAPGTKNISVLTNQLDIAVDEHATRHLIRNWKRRGACVDFYQFSKDLQMEHDVIDPLHPYAKTEIVYPQIRNRAGL